jgi:hypothetical protein
MMLVTRKGSSSAMDGVAADGLLGPADGVAADGLPGPADGVAADDAGPPWTHAATSATKASAAITARLVPTSDPLTRRYVY